MEQATMEMTQTNDLPETDPRHHALNLCSAIRELAAHAREDVKKVEGRAGRVLLEATAETLLGLAKGLEHFGNQSEEAMRE